MFLRDGWNWEELKQTGNQAEEEREGKEERLEEPSWERPNRMKQIMSM